MTNYKGFEIEAEGEQDHESGIYLSISDLMSSLFLFFALLFITVLVQLKEYQDQSSKQKNIVIGTLQGQLKANNVTVKVNEETGDVSIQDNILFDEGSAELTPKGKAFLQKFIPVYSQVIFSQPAIENQITRVVIEGHTSSKGDYEDNLELSLLRSLSVSKYIFSKDLNFKTQSRLSKKILASGRGDIESKQIDNPADRKVVFRFQFKGEEFAQWYQKKSIATVENAMNFISSPLSLPEPAQFQPNNLLELAKNLGNSSSFTSLEKLKSFPLARSRSLDEILADIQHGQANQLSSLEWVYCIQTKSFWDKEHPEHRMATSEAIWKIAAQNSWLSRILLWRLALYHGGQGEKVLAPTLAECFSIFGSRPFYFLPVRIIKALTQGQPSYEVAIIACEHLLTPKELLNSAKLPQGIPVVGKALECIAHQFTQLKLPNEQQVEWLLRCLNEMSLKQQVSAVNHLLTQVPTKVGGSFPKLVDWLRRYYAPRSTGERWHQLSEQAKRALREWIGAVNYGDFANLVDRLLQVLQLKGWEQNQLHRRKEFWANYSNRFERIRILLPQISVNALDRRLFTADIEILVTDGSDPTEVCIFDFGEWFVVEFFRGSGSEIRLFRRNAQIEQVLFSSSKLSVKQIRRLHGDIHDDTYVHDHVFCWQGSCERWLTLRENGIQPNEGTQYFKGLPKTFGIYDLKTGLPKPSFDDQQKRENKLMYWKSVIEKLEREAREYRNN